MSKPTIPTVLEPSVELRPRVAENLLAPKDLPSKSQNTISLWFQIFCNILDDKKITKKLQKMLKGTLEAEEIPKESIFDNIPERHIGRVHRRK
jgi:hypothetical protein